MHAVSSPGELQKIYSLLATVSRPFAQLVARYRERIKKGENILKCPCCGDYGVFVPYLGIPREIIRKGIHCESCGEEIIMEITEEPQAPGHEEHAKARFNLRSKE